MLYCIIDAFCAILAFPRSIPTPCAAIPTWSTHPRAGTSKRMSVSYLCRYPRVGMSYKHAFSAQQGIQALPNTIKVY